MYVGLIQCFSQLAEQGPLVNLFVLMLSNKNTLTAKTFAQFKYRYEPKTEVAAFCMELCHLGPELGGRGVTALSYGVTTITYMYGFSLVSYTTKLAHPGHSDLPR